MLIVPAMLAAALSAADASGVDADALIRAVVRSQRSSEQQLASYTFDQRETRVKNGKDGLPKEIETKLFYVLSGGGAGEEPTRELVEVNGHPATDGEKRDAAAEDAKDRQKRVERRAAEKARSRPAVSGEEDDPLVGTRKLSDLIARYDVALRGLEEVEGRATYVLDFSPRREAVARNLSETALNALAGRAYIDAADLQVRRVEAHIVAPVKVGGGLAANVREAEVHYEAEPIGRQHWFPCRIELRLKGKTAVLFRLDVAYRWELSAFKVFRVETEEAPAAPGAAH